MDGLKGVIGTIGIRPGARRSERLRSLAERLARGDAIYGDGATGARARARPVHTVCAFDLRHVCPIKAPEIPFPAKGQDKMNVLVGGSRYCAAARGTGGDSGGDHAR